MRKKIFIGLGILLALVVATLFYLNNRNRTLSPPGQAEVKSGDLTVSVSYSRPSVRNRVIFGSVDQGALQPYGKYWRAGANEPTLITFNKQVLFNNQSVAAGTYWLYAVPGADAFEILLNSDQPMWGYNEPDHALDVVKTSVPVERQTSTTEQHTIDLVEVEEGVNIIIAFEKVKLTIPVQAQ